MHTESTIDILQLITKWARDKSFFVFVPKEAEARFINISHSKYSFDYVTVQAVNGHIRLIGPFHLRKHDSVQDIKLWPSDPKFFERLEKSISCLTQRS